MHGDSDFVLVWLFLGKSFGCRKQLLMSIGGSHNVCQTERATGTDMQVHTDIVDNATRWGRTKLILGDPNQGFGYSLDVVHQDHRRAAS